MIADAGDHDNLWASNGGTNNDVDLVVFHRHDLALLRASDFGNLPNGSALEMPSRGSEGVDGACADATPGQGARRSGKEKAWAARGPMVLNNTHLRPPQLAGTA